MRGVVRDTTGTRAERLPPPAAGVQSRWTCLHQRGKQSRNDKTCTRCTGPVFLPVQDVSTELVIGFERWVCPVFDSVPPMKRVNSLKLSCDILSSNDMHEVTRYDMKRAPGVHFDDRQVQ